MSKFKCQSPPVTIPTTICLNSGNIEHWFQSSIVNASIDQWQRIHKNYIKDYRKSKKGKKDKIMKLIKQEI